MENIIISICVAVLSVFLSFGMMKYPEVKEIKSITAFKPSDKRQTICLIGIILTAFAVAVCLPVIYKTEWYTNGKKIVLCAVLWYLAYIDNRQHIIPNKSLLILVGCRLCFFIADIFYLHDGLKQEILNDIVACVGSVVIFVVMRLIVKNGIGFGDVKLFGVIGLFLGVMGTLTVIFASFVVSFFVSVFLLVTKKKGRKDQIAFAPFILVGLIVSVIFFGA